MLILTEIKYLDNTQNSYPYLKWSLKGLLTKNNEQSQYLSKRPEITSLYRFKQGKLCPTSI